MDNSEFNVDTCYDAIHQGCGERNKLVEQNCGLVDFLTSTITQEIKNNNSYKKSNLVYITLTYRQCWVLRDCNSYVQSITTVMIIFTATNNL